MSNHHLTMTDDECLCLVTVLTHGLNFEGWPSRPYTLLTRILKRLPGREELREAVAAIQRERQFAEMPQKVAGDHHRGSGV